MDTTQPGSGSAPGAAAAAVSPDPQTAALLEKHSAGVKLTPSEYGKLGAFSRWLKNPFGKGGAPAGSPQPGAQARNAAAVAAGATSQTPTDSLEPVPVDDGLCQRTAGAVLRRADAATVGIVERRARAAAQCLGLNDDQTAKIVERFRVAASLPDADKKLVVELSPDVCRELGINPREFALATVGGVLGLHMVNIWQAIDELKEMQKVKQPAKNEASQVSAPTPALTAEPVPIKPGKVEPAGQKIVEFPK